METPNDDKKIICVSRNIDSVLSQNRPNTDSQNYLDIHKLKVALIIPFSLALTLISNMLIKKIQPKNTCSTLDLTEMTQCYLLQHNQNFIEFSTAIGE